MPRSRLLKSTLLYCLVAVFNVAIATADPPSVIADIAREEEERLHSCIEKIEHSPEEAYEDGLAWQGSGSRPKARYCVAMAMIALGYFTEGALRLETLAKAQGAGSVDDRVKFLVRAGNAWLVAGIPKNAETVFDSAIKYRAGDKELHKDRATARLAQRKWRVAEEDLIRALELTPNDSEALMMRAKARLGLKALDTALADIEKAHSLDRENIDILVLRGDIREAIRVSKEK